MRWAGLALALAACGAPPSLGPGAAQCGSCHVEQHDDWSASRHARGLASPVFLALLPRVETAWGTVARARCVACHAPGHVEGEAIGCASCHLAVGNRGEANGALVVKPGGAVSARAVSSTAPHATAARGFFVSASLCGTCHEVQGPGHLDEPTLTEYRASSAAAEDSCTSCHLDEGHRFSALSPPFGASPAEAARAARSALALLQRALSLEVDGPTVRLTNVGAAHGVPTGMTALRDVWVDVEAVLASGEVRRFPRVLELGARLERDGVEVPLFTDATRVTSRSLAAGARRTWALPEAARTGLVELRATVKARALRAGVLEALDLRDLEREVPEHVVATVP